MQKLVRIIDCETTGTDTEKDRLVELASVDWTESGLGNPQQTLTNPGIPIPPGASAVHHITDAMVREAPKPEDALEQFKGPMIFAAHNARFDRKFIPFGKYWVCTYKVALRLFPDAPGHKNQVLRYYLDLPNPPAAAGATPHRALYDAWTTAHLFTHMQAQMSVEQMIKVSLQPALLPYFSFGKHAMQPMKDVPQSYFKWIVNSGDFTGEDDEDVLYTAQHHLTFGEHG